MAARGRCRTETANRVREVRGLIGNTGISPVSAIPNGYERSIERQKTGARARRPWYEESRADDKIKIEQSLGDSADAVALSFRRAVCVAFQHLHALPAG